MNSNGDICPYCGDILPEDSSPCPACRHLHERGLPDGVDLDTVEQERDLSNDNNVLCEGQPIWPQEVSAGLSSSSSGPSMLCPNPDTIATEASRTKTDDALPVEKGLPLTEHGEGDVPSSAGVVVHPPRKRRCKRHYVKALLMQQPTLDRNEPTSTCIVCGTLHFRAALSACPRCGGICKVMTLDEIDWMARLNPNLAYLPRL